ncbi:MAG: nickel/cobalt transporter [Pseudomonadota bacterium]|nr:nickel/cobalt transporter [Pseudomonadota bacterium]
MRRSILVSAAAVAAAVLSAAALAAPGPFGVAPPEATIGAPDGTGIFGRILALQGAFYQAMTGAVRALKADGAAVWTLAGLSFLYGVVHAAGPGHGKAVITSYLLANERTLRRGILLSFASAAVQATVAVAAVGVLAVAFRATSLAMNQAAQVLEITSYALIMAVGAWLLAAKLGFGRRRRLRPVSVGAAAVHDHAGCCGHGHHPTGHSAPERPHDHHACCGHSHAPDPRRLEGESGWKAVSTVLAVGLRPCTGAIIVLVFALSQGLFWAGIVSAYVMGLGTAITVSALAVLAVGAKGLAIRLTGRMGAGAGRLHRAIEIAGAAAVFLLGALLLVGALTTGGMPSA